MIFSKNGYLEIDLPDDDLHAPGAAEGPATPNESGEPVFDLQVVEKQTIEAALARTGGNQVKAAILLNISRQALERRIKKHQIRV